MDAHDGHGHAVVVGSGIAGLTAARALANFMDKVTVVERDWVPRGAVVRRRGIPQARHTHILTAAAEQGLEQLFPGIGRDLTDAGAVRVRPADMLVLGPAGWLPRTTAGPAVLSAGRDLIDSAVRDRLRADPRVDFLHSHEAVALQGGRDDTVTGVWVRRRDRNAPGGWGPRRLISAEFVVDATGSASRAPQWLADLGYDRPRETTVRAPGGAYATAVFAPPIGHVADFTSLLITASPDHPGRGVLHPVEGGRWSVTVSTGDGPPPTDHAAFLHAAGALRHPLLHDLLAHATPLGPVRTGRHTPSRRRHYEKLRRWPDQFLVVGDACLSLDSAHGQGMTTAIDCALVLDQLLAVHGTAVGLSYRLRRALAHRLAPAWRAAARTAPAPGPRERAARRWAARLDTAATRDPHTAALLLTRLHTPDRAPAALHPRTLLAGLRPGPRTAGAQPPSTTHGPGARRRPAPAPGGARPAAGVSTGSARFGPATGSSAGWPAAAPAGDRPRPRP
ncbi:FAD-dependent monooxygenase [Streptomyces sp. NPDC006610]|uniref:FAD-dependent oxidoreductase n=1 Tax=Streptomyces sp. NPDC006610 TaxID=3154584 RepID=UPI0033A59B9F